MAAYCFGGEYEIGTDDKTGHDGDSCHVALAVRDPLEERDTQASADQDRRARTDRNLADAHLALARFLYTIDWNVDTAKLEVNQALELNPRNAQALRLASELASTRGQTDRALDFASKAIMNDPLGSRGFTRIAAAEIGKGNLVGGSSRTSQSARVKPDGGSGALSSRVGAGS